ncbi:type IV pilus twitching motility protein PilT [Ammoniphilus sp. YIM 78166]|uniref:type IV pilus twitching motility protein PilT n=1 Tax=Ammoniphilus sp. YIM 78166 TaxID=1644106 RepID=UPI00106F72EB|nr:type IV pilus twitching motility protein PilT [Ammoniphilus sp. YIM 78166]
MDIIGLLKEAQARGASDLHLTIGKAPVFRINGMLIPLGECSCTPDWTESVARDLMNEGQFEQLLIKGECDFSFGVAGISRFRINAYRQRGSISLAIRTIAQDIPPIDRLGIPPVVRQLAERHQGLLLVTGPTGSGKSTTLASVVDYINQSFSKHIITLEDPIEYLHGHKKSIVDQREIGTDTSTFSTGLRSALRQDPDVILVGEMRDLETISTAISAAETGHLVLATLHTSDAPQTIDRIIDVFPPAQQQQIRVQLAGNLAAVISQRLLPAMDGSQRMAAFEVMINNTAIANLIRQEKVHQIKSMMQTGMQQGMITMEQSLRMLMNKGIVSPESVKQIIPDLDRYFEV